MSRPRNIEQRLMVLERRERGLEESFSDCQLLYLEMPTGDGAEQELAARLAELESGARYAPPAWWKRRTFRCEGEQELADLRAEELSILVGELWSIRFEKNQDAFLAAIEAVPEVLLRERLEFCESKAWEDPWTPPTWWNGPNPGFSPCTFGYSTPEVRRIREVIG